MSRDAQESLTALVGVLFLVGVLWLIPLALRDVDIPRWVPLAGFGLQIVTLVALIIRRQRRNADERPE